MPVEREGRGSLVGGVRLAEPRLPAGFVSEQPQIHRRSPPCCAPATTSRQQQATPSLAPATQRRSAFNARCAGGSTHPCRLPSCPCGRPYHPAACLRRGGEVQVRQWHAYAMWKCSTLPLGRVSPPAAKLQHPACCPHTPAGIQHTASGQAHLAGQLPLPAPPSPLLAAPAEPLARGVRPAAAASMREVCTPEGGVLGCRPQLHFITLPPRACREGKCKFEVLGSTGRVMPNDAVHKSAPLDHRAAQARREDDCGTGAGQAAAAILRYSAPPARCTPAAPNTHAHASAASAADAGASAGSHPPVRSSPQSRAQRPHAT